jgi:creatinine amidohydrolase
MSAEPTHRVHLAEMTRDDCRVAARAGAVALIPIAATEQHGPHLPAGTDTLTTDAVVDAALGVLTGGVPVVVCPMLAYGCSAHHVRFGATASLSSATLLAVLIDLGDSLVASGFTRLLFVNGHGGNHHVMQVAATELAERHDVAVGAASWWQLAEDEMVERGALERGHLPGHAGAFEVSMMLALRPELVREPRPERPAQPGAVGLRTALTVRRSEDWTAIDGYSDSPRRGEAVHGTEYLHLSAAALAAAIERMTGER